MRRNNGSEVFKWAGAGLAIILSAALLGGCNDPQEPPKDPSSGNSPASEDLTVAGDVSTSVNIADLAGDEVQLALKLIGPESKQGIITTTVYFCSSPNPLTEDTGNGNITVAVDDVDPPGRSTGDSYTTTYNACVMFGRTLDGESTFMVVDFAGDPTAPPPAIWSIKTTASTDLTITAPTSTRVLKSTYAFSDGTSDGITYTRIAEGASDTTVTRNGTPQTRTHTFRMQFEKNVATNTYSRTVDVATTGHGDALIETLEPLAGTLGSPPESGSIQITRTTTAGVKSITTITAVGGGDVRIDVDSNGDGTIDSTTTVPWPATIGGLWFAIGSWSNVGGGAVP